MESKLVVEKINERPPSSESHLPGTNEVCIPVPWGYIRGYSWGNPTGGRRVLALHGWLDNSGTYFGLLPLLSKDDLFIVAIDFAGHGRSSPRSPGSNYHFEEYLVDVQFVLTALGWEQGFTIIGHSMGGAAALWFAGSFPSRVAGIVTLDILCRDDYSPFQIIDLLTQRLRGLEKQKQNYVYPTFEMVAEKLRSNYSRFDLGFTLEAARALCERGVAKVDNGYTFSFVNDIKSEYLLPAEKDVDRSILQAITCPILFISCRHSLQAKINMNHGVHKKIGFFSKTKVQVVEVDGGHHTHLYAPSTMASTIDSFLTSSNNDHKSKL